MAMPTIIQEEKDERTRIEICTQFVSGVEQFALYIPRISLGPENLLAPQQEEEVKRFVTRFEADAEKLNITSILREQDVIKNIPVDKQDTAKEYYGEYFKLHRIYTGQLLLIKAVIRSMKKGKNTRRKLIDDCSLMIGYLQNMIRTERERIAVEENFKLLQS